MRCWDRCRAMARCVALVCDGARCGSTGPSLDETLSCRGDGETESTGPSRKCVDRCFESGDAGRESTGEGSTEVAGELSNAFDESESSAVEPTDDDGETCGRSGALKDSMLVVDSSCTGAEICERSTGLPDWFRALADRCGAAEAASMRARFEVKALPSAMMSVVRVGDEGCLDSLAANPKVERS